MLGATHREIFTGRRLRHIAARARAMRQISRINVSWLSRSSAAAPLDADDERAIVRSRCRGESAPDAVGSAGTGVAVAVPTPPKVPTPMLRSMICSCRPFRLSRGYPARVFGAVMLGWCIRVTLSEMVDDTSTGGHGDNKRAGAAHARKAVAGELSAHRRRAPRTFRAMPRA